MFTYHSSTKTVAPMEFSMAFEFSHFFPNKVEIHKTKTIGFTLEFLKNKKV
jgi:hypothetical protein